MRRTQRFSGVALRDKAQGTPPTDHLKDCFSNETAVALAPFGVCFKGFGEAVVEDLVLLEYGLNDIGSGEGQNAVYSHSADSFAKTLA